MTESAGKRLMRRALSAAARRRASCVFVLSTGRVGTVTLTHLLNLSPAVDAEHEPGPQLLEETRRAYQAHPLPGPEATALMRTFAASRVRPLVRAARGRVYVESSNRLTFLAPQLSAHLPRSRFIHLHRDPATVVRSGMRRGWYDNHPWDPYRIQPRPDDPWAGDWERWGAFERCCWFWTAANQFCLHVVDRLPADRVFATGMEALFAADGEGAHRLFAWMHVPPGAPEDIRRVTATRYNAQQGRDFPIWSEWTREQRAALARIAAPVAVRLGYDRYAEPD